MKRRAAPTEAAKFSLFPFLAVLLCVMGALIVLLIVIAQRTHDRAVARSEADEAGEHLKVEREELGWRIDMIRASRDQTAAQLAEQRAGLSHIEDHARRLREQYRALQQAAKDLQDSLKSPSVANKALDDQMAAIQARIQEVTEALDAKKLVPQQAAGYAIMPYEGPNGTQRRPMYIECTDDGIILQPEGVVLTADDFLGSLGPGNPLAASMRAAREYLLRNRNNDGREAGEPYPLLLIRPDGIGAYYVARAALTSWGSEFGYEFVDQDWKLEYQELDPQLLAVTKAAAEDARERQRLLAAAAPKVFQGTEDDGTYFRASPSTGGVMVDGRSGRRSSSGRRSGSARGAGGGSGNGDDSLLGDQDGPKNRGGFQRSGDGMAANEGGGYAGQSGESGGGQPGSSGQSATQGTEASQPESSTASRSNGQEDKAPGGEPLRQGQYMPKQSLASQRGKDWAVRDQGPSAVPISRKIRVRCTPEQLEILADGSTKSEHVVALGPRTEDSMEELVSRVWDHMDRWGIAGQNMYWKPQLLFETTPDSQPRYQEIKALLEGSGLDVAEKTKASTARGATKKPR
jgi:hypothetical protein